MNISRRELNKINSRKRILKASRRLFSSKGYENTMIADIAEKAEVSKATLYNYFPNKESLLAGMENELINKIIDLVRTNLDDSADKVEMIRYALEELVCASAEYHDIARRITYLNSCKDSTLYDGRRDIEKLFHDLAEKAREEKLFRSDADPNEVTDSIMGIFLVTQFQWDVEKLTSAQLKEKLNRYFDSAMAGYLI